MTYKVTSTDDYTLNLSENNRIDSVLQNIAVLLNTRKGTVPMYREFGLPMNFIDNPIDVAETIAYAEITDALERFEPRAELVGLGFVKLESGNLGITVEVEINDEQSY